MKEKVISSNLWVLAKEKGYDFSDKKPTQSLLQKWFRDIHNIDAMPLSAYDNKNKKYYYDCVCYNGGSLPSTGRYKTYEIALKKSLYLAFTLI